MNFLPINEFYLGLVKCIKFLQCYSAKALNLHSVCWLRFIEELLLSIALSLI